MSTKAFKALREFDGGVRYENADDDVGTRACCGVASYKPHAENCDFIAGLREYESLLPSPERLSIGGVDIVRLREREPKVGDVFYNPELDEVRQYDGRVWVLVV